MDIQAHLTLEEPASRNYLASSLSLMDGNWSTVDYCPFCLNLGSVGAVSSSNGTAYTWPEGNNGGSTVCGDPPSGTTPQYMISQINQPFRRYNYLWNRYRTFGKAILRNTGFNVTVRFSTYHAGAIQMQLCVIPNWTRARERTMLTNECFEQRILKQAAINAAQPGSKWWYLPAVGAYTEGWRGRTTTRFRLPTDVACNFFNDKTKCVLRMYYLTGNTCNVPNVPAVLKATTTKSYLPVCGTSQSGYPEEFRYVCSWGLTPICVHPPVCTIHAPSTQQLCRHPCGGQLVLCGSKASGQHHQCIPVHAAKQCADDYDTRACRTNALAAI